MDSAMIYMKTKTSINSVNEDKIRRLIVCFDDNSSSGLNILQECSEVAGALNKLDSSNKFYCKRRYIFNSTYDPDSTGCGNIQIFEGKYVCLYKKWAVADI